MAPDPKKTQDHNQNNQNPSNDNQTTTTNNNKRSYTRFANPPPFRPLPALPTNKNNSNNNQVSPSEPKPPPFLPPSIPTNRFNSPNLPKPSQQFRKPPPFKKPSSPQLPPLPMPPSTPSLPTLLHSSLSSTPSIPLPSLPFLTQLCASRVPPPPLASLLATARARILAADLTTPQLLDPTYISSHSFPSNLYNPQTESLSLSIDTIVQVLDIENLSKSRWEQIEELEAAARGETKRGREIIRITEDENNNNNNDNAIDRGQTQATQAQTQAAQQQQQQQQQNTKATHKLLLQDVKGQKVYGLELHKVDSIGVDTISIGGKVLLKRGTKVCRGVVMLEPGFTVVLGGKVGVWDKSWREGRLERLKRSAEGGGEN